MRIQKINNPKINFAVILKIVVAISLYIFIFVYTIPVFNATKIFVGAKLANDTKIILIGDTVITVEIADSIQERAKGLSGREELKKNTGMLFVFDKPDVYGIWMKDMEFDIDILWLDEYNKIISIVENATPLSYPKTFLPDKPALYVLEVPAGFTKQKNIKLGDKIDFY